MSDELKNTYPECKKLYRDIIFGFSEKRLRSSKKKVYIKHLNEIDNGESGKKYDDHFFLAQKKGLKSEKDALKFIIEQDLWSEEKENKLKEKAERLKTLKYTKQKLIIKKQVDELIKEIDPIEKEVYLLSHERAENIGLTAEVFASKKINEFIIQQSFFSDKDLSKAFYSEEEFDLLEQEDIDECLLLFAEINSDFSDEQIRLIAICPFFMNSFYLCGESTVDFFRKAVIELTNYQVSLLSSGRYFKNLISNSKPAPDDYYESPQKLSDWYNLQDKARVAKDSLGSKGDGGGSTIVGASKEEMRSLQNDDEEAVDLNKLAQEKGSISFEELLDIHGI
ncbi:hypothetical protein CMI37_10160 [Candidatus Pacearchaeota archaeon]|nr:hypothetical protein [Candidatus Pacearchaeota archaeon]